MEFFHWVLTFDLSCRLFGATHIVCKISIISAFWAVAFKRYTHVVSVFRLDLRLLKATRSSVGTEFCGLRICDALEFSAINLRISFIVSKPSKIIFNCRLFFQVEKHGLNQLLHLPTSWSLRQPRSFSLRSPQPPTRSEPSVINVA